MSVPRISNNSFWGFGSASVSRFTNFLDFNFNCDDLCDGQYDQGSKKNRNPKGFFPSGARKLSRVRRRGRGPRRSNFL